MRPSLIVSLLIVLVASPADATERVGISDLLERMTDLRALAEAPAPGERLLRFSSADPNFRGNLDFGWYLRADGAESVLADVEGPGAIVRIWSANPEGTLRIYVDAETPALEADFDALLRGAVLPFAYPFAGVRGRGGNLYFPIPFERRCRVTIESARSDSLYYHVEARRFPAGTRVSPFSPAALEAADPAVERTARALEAATEPGAPTITAADAVEAGRPLSVRLDGPAAVRELRVTFDAPPSREALRGLVLEARWDGETEPSVLVPLGDFFGTAPGVNPYRSLPLEVRSDGVLISRWYMPFERSAEIAVRNEAPGAARLRLDVWGESRPWTASSLRFHAGWRIETAIEMLALFPFAGIRGTGRYVGTALSVYNPHPSWWGEGDEFIYVDGETFPSIRGTGTEDYFGYAWYATALFSHAFHAQTLCEGPGNKGHTSDVRFHILDSIPFEESLEGVFEIYWRFLPDFASTAYWYARPGGSKPPPLPPAEARRPRPVRTGRVFGVFPSTTHAIAALFTLLLTYLWWGGAARRARSEPAPKRRR